MWLEEYITSLSWSLYLGNIFTLGSYFETLVPLLKKKCLRTISKVLRPKRDCVHRVIHYSWLLLLHRSLGNCCCFLTLERLQTAVTHWVYLVNKISGAWKHSCWNVGKTWQKGVQMERGLVQRRCQGATLAQRCPYEAPLCSRRRK